MADFNEPQLTSTYTSFLSGLKDRDTDLAALFANDTVSTSNFPARAVRFNTTSNKFQRRNSANSGFEDLTSNHHFPAITIDGSGTLTVGGAITGASLSVTGSIEGANINVTGTGVPANGLNEPANNVLGLCSNTTLKWTIDSSGRLFNNGQAAHQGTSTSDLQIYNSSGGRIDLLRVDSNVGPDNILGRIAAYSQENADNSFSSCAEINFRSEIGHSNSDHSTRIEFYTTGGQSLSINPRVVGCFDEFGFLGVGDEVGDNPAAPLHINAGDFTSNVAIFASEQSNNDCTIGIKGKLTNNFDNRIHAEGANMSLRVNGNTTPAIALDSTGIVAINKSNPLGFTSSSDHDAALQVAGTGADASIVIGRGSANVSPPTLEFNKYRTVSYSLGTALQADDVLGSITFSGADGTNITESHRIRTQIITPDFSGNAVSVATGKIPVELQLRTMNNDGGTLSYMKIDHNGHIQYTPHSQPSGGGQNQYAIDIRTSNNNGTGNLIRFTDTDTSAASGTILGGLQFFSSDSGAQNSGLLGEINVDYDSGTPHGNMNFRLSGQDNLTIVGSTNHVGINNSAPEHDLDVNGDALIKKLLVSSDTIQFVDANDNAALQVTGNSNAEAMINVTRVGDSGTNFPTVVLTKNHNAGATGNTACPDESTLGALEFQGTNGTGFDLGARIIAKTNEAWTSSTHGANMIFQVANGTNVNGYMVLTGKGVLNIGDSSLENDFSNSGDARLVIVDGSAPDVLLHRRDSSVGGSNELGAIKCSDSDGGIPAPPSASLSFRAAEPHSATEKGTDIRMQMCANGTTSLTTRFTFRDSGAFGVNGDTVGNTHDVLVSKGNAPPEYQPLGAKVWVLIDGTGTPSITNDFGVTSVADAGGTGNYTINFSTNFANANYVGLTGTSRFSFVRGDNTRTTSSCQVSCDDSSGVGEDPSNVNVAIFGET